MKPGISPLIVGLLVAATAGCGEPLAVEPTNELETSAPHEPQFSHTRPFLFGEQQPVVDLGRGFTHAIFPEGGGQNLTQTFSTSRLQRLGFIQIPVACASGVLLKVRIREGVGGPILSDFNTAGLPTVVDGTFQLIQVFDPVTSHGIKLKKDQTYAIELSSVPTGVETTCGLAPGPAVDSYPNGEGLFEDVPTNGPGWIPLPGGEDLPFITLVN